MVSLCPMGDSSSTLRQCATTVSPGFQALTPGPTRSTTPEASDPMTWYGRSWRLASACVRPYFSRNPNVETGSKMLVHTVL